MKTRRPAALTGACVAAIAFLAACRPNMLEQPRIDPFEPSAVFEDGSSARLPVADTVARGALTPDVVPPGDQGASRDAFPVAITLERLERGRERFDIYCAPCHSRTGNGDGMVVRRGFRQPPSYFEPRLLEAPPRHFVDVITDGFGAMPPLGYLVAVDDRWSIAAYIRALQLTVEDANQPPRTATAPRVPGGG